MIEVILFCVLYAPHMKRIIPFAILLLLAGCTDKTPDPVSTAVVSEIMSYDPNYTKVKLLELVKVDSTTFGQEIERRSRIFESKKKSDEKFLLKYTAEKKKKNAALKQESMNRDILILAGLDSIKTSISERLNDVAYYEYRFNAEAISEGGKTLFKDSYAALTPDGKLLGIASKQDDLHKNMGVVIDGYLELVKGVDTEETEE